MGKKRFEESNGWGEKLGEFSIAVRLYFFLYIAHQLTES